MAARSKVREFVEASFYRKLGKENLLEYMNKLKHPHKAELTAILGKITKDEEITHAVSEELQTFFQSDENPNSFQDLENFIKINDLAGERGNAKMHSFCQEIEELQKYISNADKQKHNGHQLAFNLFINERETFEELHCELELEFIGGWKLFKSKINVKLAEKPKEQIKAFQEALKSCLKEEFHNENIHIDFFEDKLSKRIILCGCYADLPSRIEDWTKKELEQMTVRPKRDFYCVFYPSQMIIKTKTFKQHEDLSEEIMNCFVNNFLTEPSKFLDNLEEQVFDITVFNTKNNFPDLPDESLPIENIRISGFRYQPFIGSAETFTVHIRRGKNKRDIDEVIKNRNKVILQMVALEFEFEGKGNSRFKTIEVRSENRIGNLNEGIRDGHIRECLKHWEVLK